MSRQVAGKTFLTTEEVSGRFGWSRDSLYRFHRRALIHPNKFLGDKKTYWDTAQLEILKLQVIQTGPPRPNYLPDFAAETASPPAGILHKNSEESRKNAARLANLPDMANSKAAHDASAIGSDLEILQVWLNNYPELTQADKQAIWQIANKTPGHFQPFEAVRPEEPDFTDKLLADWKRERPEIDENLFALFGRLQRAGRSFDREVARALGSHGLKVSEFLVLAALRRSGPPYSLTPTELFKSLLITSGTITKRIERLENRHLVERRPDPADGRGTQVYLTPAGKALVDEAVAAPGEEPYQWLQKVLTPLERKLFERILRKMLRARESDHLS